MRAQGIALGWPFTLGMLAARVQAQAQWLGLRCSGERGRAEGGGGTLRHWMQCGES